MNCRRCNENLSESWNFCPKCGMQISSMVPNTVTRVIPLQSGTLKINIMRGSPVKQGVNEDFTSFKGEVVEPLTEIVKEDNGVKIVIKMPGVKDPGTISLKRVGDSLEINAYTENKRYFKIINLEKLNVSKKDFSNETLYLTLA